MKRIIATSLLLAAWTLLAFLPVNVLAEKGDPSAESIQDLHVCVMHPWVYSDGGGTCELCNMQLAKVHGHTAGDPLPPVEKITIDPDNPLWLHEGSGTSPKGKQLIPITESPYYEPPAKGKTTPDENRSKEGAEVHAKERSSAEDNTESSPASQTQLWTCGMHPEVIQDEPGLCPICHMDLIPLKGSTASGSGAQVNIDPVTLQNIGVVTVPVERRTLSREIRTNATVKVAEDRETKITARVMGYVEKLHVARTGDRVRKGQPLLALYSPELVTAQEELLLAKRTLASSEKSAQERLTRNSTALLDAARKRLSLWDINDEQIAQIEASGEVRRQLELKSPTDGIILDKNVTEGAAVKPGTTLFTIGNLNRIWVVAQVYEFEVPWVKEGDPVRIRSAYDPHLALVGIIDYIYPTLDPKTRTMEVRISLPNHDGQLKPEMWVDVTIESSPRDNRLTVPKSAVVRSGKRDLVFVKVGDGLFEPEMVQLGVETDEYYEILTGLEAGQQVVTSAQFLLDSEAKLQEAIQKRIAARAQKGLPTEEMDNTTPEGHVH